MRQDDLVGKGRRSPRDHTRTREAAIKRSRREGINLRGRNSCFEVFKFESSGKYSSKVSCQDSLFSQGVWPPIPEENYRKLHLISEEWVDKVGLRDDHTADNLADEYSTP